MTRELLVTAADGEFKIAIPDDAKVTFGPFSPPTGKEMNYRNEERAKGTLRVYEGGKSKASESILAVFTQVISFREISRIDYSKKIAVEEGATVWKSDQNGYQREEKVNRKETWQGTDATGLLESDESKKDVGF